MSDLPVLIIGAGIGGLTTALALRQAGYSVRVFERAQEVKEVGAGLTLWANALGALRKLGLEHIVRDLGRPDALPIGFYTARGKQLMQLSPDEMTRHLGAPPVAVHRAELLAALRDAVGRDSIECGARLIAFEQDEDEVTGIFANGQRVRGCLLIGADGIHSQVRQQLFPGSQPRYAGYTAWRGVATGVKPELMGELWGRGLRFGIAPLTRDRVYWFVSCNMAEHEAESVESRSYLLTLFRGWHPLVSELLKATEAASILRNDIYDLAPLASWSQGRVTLLGDAAHAMTPNMGQGACQAIEDACALAAALRTAHALPEALRLYQQQRLKHANGVLARSHMIGTVAQWEHPVACLFRERVLALTPGRLFLKQLQPIAGGHA
ncbi:2-polyprenyl-6-methoxyphenol hydroxylase-like FAD-dependent oxidoreductase [Thermosporothrix hazakensis]|jgi:2-polyprenyl-6-methoxyphenol hydroxylase-like FAD-dependent oxidoreductase|uniref:2-polyprenyl-6-methoxyphenol hydroxylase-like FAD-dependent oxidoreductase n=1 Tax=Thermosporothrix hazakensis TaxID=644383 RepID=A0A326U6A1_THEHA|nr:FAD-dependent monooxygenase [Thermosporothrix hazakensis]PZW28484.1 2-polyprenyl-6-methoxyphenol hydroxylase-like FAD-dependent oxidoreductase [Thermosporothrix hazakensis]GCE45259.1 monooxygenase [Thermosporothrix hazakensis]